jgi:hypothetical protein
MLGPPVLLGPGHQPAEVPIRPDVPGSACGGQQPLGRDPAAGLLHPLGHQVGDHLVVAGPLLACRANTTGLSAFDHPLDGRSAPLRLCCRGLREPPVANMNLNPPLAIRLTTRDGATSRGRSSRTLMIASTEPHLHRPLDAVDAVELRSDLTQLLGPDAGTQLSKVGDQGRPHRVVRFATRASRSATRGSDAVRESTSPAKTTAAAGAPPMTDANDPSTASTVIAAFSALAAHHECAAVMPIDTEHDRPLVVHDRPADLCAVTRAAGA